MNMIGNHRLKKIVPGVVSYILIISMLLSCAGTKTEKKDPFFDKWKAMAEKSRGYSPVPKRCALDLPDKRNKADSKPKLKREPEKKRPLPAQEITLKMHKTDVAVVLRTMARAVNQNIMINETIRGSIDINVKNAPWDQVFHSILRTQGLTYDWEGDIICIITLEDREKNLKQLEAEQQIQSKKREMEMVEPLLTRLINVEFADAKSLKENLEKFLTEKTEGKPLGSVMVDEHTNSLIIQAIRKDMERMIPLIEELDRPTPQILIEAHIVETTKDTAQELGIQWGGLYHGDNYWITPGANSQGILDQSLSEEGIDPTSGFASNFPADLADGMGMTIGYVAENIGNSILNVQLSALQIEGKLNILSSPSITTLDNQPATIESGSEVPFQTVEDDDVKIEFKKAVLSLKVTPHVIKDQMLKMNIITHNDELDFTRTVVGYPTIITKKAQTNVMLFDGQTTVIGGLSKEKTGRSENGVPLLKHIPLFGYLFKGKGNNNSMEEVLIFITPHILKEKIEDEAFQGSIEKP